MDYPLRSYPIKTHDSQQVELFKELYQAFQIKWNMSTAYRPQTDEQSEWMN